MLLCALFSNYSEQCYEMEDKDKDSLVSYHHCRERSERRYFGRHMVLSLSLIVFTDTDSIESQNSRITL